MISFRKTAPLYLVVLLLFSTLLPTNMWAAEESDTTQSSAKLTVINAPEETTNAEGLDKGDLAWMLVSCALVLMMTAPGLALFYGGLVRKKNILSVMMQCVFLMGVMSIVWALWGYSLAFGQDILGGFVGGSDYVLMNNVLPEWVGKEAKLVEYEGEDGPYQVKYQNTVLVPMAGSIPRSIHMLFQMMFFIITPALICGAFAERMKFSAMVLFSILWGTFVYCPLAHWVWSDNGWLFTGTFEAFDFAGGTVVHISSGVSALICALMLGQRLGYRQDPMPPHNLTYTFIGATMLWVGWFGFNAGSAVASDAAAANAFLATHLAAAAGVIAWAGAEWITRKKPSILGACSGAVAGLVCITPACGVVTPLAGIILGFVGGLACYWACTTLKGKWKYDDSLDAFGVHGVGGTMGALLTGVFACRAVKGSSKAVGLLEGNANQLLNQGISVVAAAGLAIVGTILIVKILDATIGMRVTQDEEIRGLDLSLHGEEGYIFSVS